MGKSRTPAIRWLWPTLYTPEPGKDCYCPRALIQQEAATNGYSRAWRVGGELVSLQRRDGTYLKSLDNFPAHAQEPDAFYGMLEECFSYGSFRPTAYHDPIYSKIEMPRIKWSINALLAPQFAGGWNAAIVKGMFAGSYIVYDIQSAYLSALAYGLPDPATFRHIERLGPDAVYVLDIEPEKHLPYPYESFTRVNATLDEIEIYNLKVKKVLGGVRWSRDWRANSISDAIKNLSFWKEAGRAYWGRWAMTDRVEMLGGNSGSVTPLRSVFTNMVWAHLILSRIRMRLYHEFMLGDVLHVFTDSIIGSRHRRIGRKGEIGSWKLAKVYPEGIYIKGPGQYGPMLGDLDKHAGIAWKRPAA